MKPSGLPVMRAAIFAALATVVGAAGRGGTTGVGAGRGGLGAGGGRGGVPVAWVIESDEVSLRQRPAFCFSGVDHAAAMKEVAYALTTVSL